MIAIIGKISVIELTKMIVFVYLSALDDGLRKNKLQIQAACFWVLHEAMHLHDFRPIERLLHQSILGLKSSLFNDSFGQGSAYTEQRWSSSSLPAMKTLDMLYFRLEYPFVILFGHSIHSSILLSPVLRISYKMW